MQVAEDRQEGHVSPPSCCHLPEERYGVHHGRRVIGWWRQAGSKFVSQGDHMVGQVKAVILEDGSYSRHSLESASMLNGDNLRNSIKGIKDVIQQRGA